MQGLILIKKVENSKILEHFEFCHLNGCHLFFKTLMYKFLDASATWTNPMAKTCCSEDRGRRVVVEIFRG